MGYSPWGHKESDMTDFTFTFLKWGDQSLDNFLNKAEVDVFLEFSCFFSDPADAGNLVSGSSAFSIPTLMLSKLGAKNLEFLLPSPIREEILGE